jgi:hypothetical protein
MTMPPLPADTDLDLEPDADGELDAPARSGIQSIEVGFRLLEVLTHTTGPMMLRDLAREPEVALHVDLEGLVPLTLGDREHGAEVGVGRGVVHEHVDLAEACEGLGDDAHSWAVDGTRQRQWHKGQKAWKCKWRIGDVIGLACDLDKMQMHVSLNGSFAAPHGVVFELAPDAAAEGLFAAFSGKTGKVRFNLNEADFRHAPPAADFQAYATFER